MTTAVEIRQLAASTVSVADRVRSVITSSKTSAEQAAVDAVELERHIERTKTERARRAATATDLQRQLTELIPRRDLLRARRDRGLATQLDDVDQMDQDLAALETREVELTAELAEAVESVKRADLAIPDLQQRQKAAIATVVNDKRRANLASLAATSAEFEEWAQRGVELWRRAQVEANREETLAAQVAVPRTDMVVVPSRIPPLGYLGQDPSQLVESVRQFRKLLGQV